MDPLAVGAGHHALGPQDGAVGGRVVQPGQDALDLVLRVLVGRLHAPAGEHLVGVVAVVVLRQKQWYTCAGWEELLLANFASNPL